VRVNGVVPGPVLLRPDYTKNKIRNTAENTLLGRWGDPQDGVEAILFLVRSDFITGEPLAMDGGERWIHRR
jgi:NAD(P)-dependent dehydrogenase (short-subunit alcohol dehydrogenase family)